VQSGGPSVGKVGKCDLESQQFQGCNPRMPGFVSGALFLRSSRVCPTLLMASERLPRMGTARRKHMSGVRRLVREAYVSCVLGFPLQGVHRFESS
jgi:hypothetical protein